MRATFLLTALLLAAGLLVMFFVQERFIPAASEARAKGMRGMWQQWVAVFQAPSIAALFSVRFLYFLGRAMLPPFAPLLIAEIMTNQQRIGTMTGLMIGLGSVAGTLSSVYLGNLGDRLGHRRILLYSALAGGIFYIPQTFSHNVTELIIYNVFVGIAAGGVIPAVSALINQATAGGSIGVAFGLDNAVASAARGISPLIGAGVVFFFGYRGVFIASSLTFISVALVALWYLPKHPAYTRAAPD